MKVKPIFLYITYLFSYIFMVILYDFSYKKGTSELLLEKPSG